MLNNHIINFTNVSKAYRLGENRYSLRNAIGKKFHALLKPGEKETDTLFWALKNVSFSLNKGDILGLLGPNGAGKTTILKLLSHITSPSSGTIKAGGNIAALIELGAGFHPDLTGRENVFLNAAILGIPLDDLKRKFDQIVSFSGLERFIDTPVKRYSSGMYVRLGFAVAAHVDSEIFLVDEVLAVGDAQFRKRCLKRIEELRKTGTTIIFVSHNLYMVQSVCNRGIFLLNGEIQYDGDVNNAINEYERWMREEQIQFVVKDNEQVDEDQPSIVEIREVTIVSLRTDKQDDLLDYRFASEVRVHYYAKTVIRHPNLYFKILQVDGNTCCMVRTMDYGYVLDDIQGEGTIIVTLEPLQLAPGAYCVDAELLENQDFVVLAQRHSNWFQVAGSKVGHEGVYMPCVVGARVQHE